MKPTDWDRAYIGAKKQQDIDPAFDDRLDHIVVWCYIIVICSIALWGILK